MHDKNPRFGSAIAGLALVTLWLTLSGCSQSPRSSRPTQAVDRFALEEGGRLFQKYCAPCHGPAGRGDGRFFASSLSPPPPDLTSAEFERSRNDADLIRVINLGTSAIGKSDLCPSWGKTFSATEIEYLVAFIRVFQQQQIAEQAGH